MTCNAKWALGIIFFQLLLAELSAQVYNEHFNVVNYTIEDGLPSNELYWTHQDRTGDLWIASDHGVAVYNGEQIRTFSSEDGLPDNTVFRIDEDSHQRLWFLTYRGGVCYYEDDRFIVPPFNEELIEIFGPKNYPNQIRFSGKEIFIAGRYSTDFFIRVDENGEIHRESLVGNQSKPQATGKNLVWSLKLDSSNSLSGIYEVSSPNVGKRQLESRGRVLNRDITFYDLKETRNNRHCIWEREASAEKIIVQHEEVMFQDSNRNIYDLHFPSTVLDIQVDGSDFFFATMGGGLLHFKDRLDSNCLVGNYFSSLSISSILQDNKGAFWLTTMYNGLIKVPSFETTVFKIPAEANALISLPVNIREDTLRYVEGNILHTVRISDGRIFSRQVLMEFSRQLKREKLVWLDNGELIFNYQVFSLYDTSADTLHGRPLITERPTSFIQEVKPSLYESKILYATRRGFFILDSPGVSFDSNLHGFDHETYCLLEMGPNLILAGTESGLFKCNIEEHSFEPYGIDELNRSIKDLDIDAYGRIWILVEGNGVFVQAKDSIFQIDRTHGLSSDWCQCILLDDTIAWIGTNAGLNRLCFNEKNIFKISAKVYNDGLASNYVDQVLKGSGGQVVANSGRKLTFLHSTKDWYEQSPEALIDEVSVGDSTYSRHELQTIQYGASDNNVGIKFRVNALLEDKTVWYKYRLSGRDSNWTYSDKRSVFFADLDPGKYQFQLQARSAGGGWSKELVTYSFVIPQHLSEVLWFRLLLLLFLVVVTIMVMKLLNRRQQKRILIEHQMTLSGIRALRSQINPHFMFNALNSIRHFLLNDRMREADHYLTKFSGLLRGLLKNMEQNKVSLDMEIKTITNYLMLEEIRLKEGLDWIVEVEAGLDTRQLFLPPMLLQPILENAIWHGIGPLGLPGKVSTEFKVEKDVLFCIITDNGIGFDMGQQVENGNSQGMGLRNIRERLQLFARIEGRAYDLIIENLPGNERGTQVILQIPQ